MCQDKKKILIVADNPESENFWLAEELMGIYKFSYVTNEAAYEQETTDREIAAVVMTTLKDSNYPGDNWKDKIGVVEEARKEGTPVIVMDSGDGKTEKARKLGAVVMEMPSESGELVKKLEELNI